MVAISDLHGLKRGVQDGRFGPQTGWGLLELRVAQKYHYFKRGELGFILRIGASFKPYIFTQQ